MTDSLAHSVPLPEAPDPDVQQRKASAPDSLVWVSASAGSGKTTVLTNRVLRLLLPDPEGRFPGTPPHRLLCITFTKAAAAEMALRVQKNLSAWAVMEEGELSKKLHDLTGHQPDAAMIRAARKLFADVLDCPGGLKLLTIHSFCQSVLGRFPLEAGITPDFSVMDEPQAQDMFDLALEDVLLRSQRMGNNDEGESFRLLAPFLTLDDLRANIRDILRHPERLEAAFASQTTLETLTASLKSFFGLSPDASIRTLGEAFIAATPFQDLRRALETMMSGKKTIQAMAIGIQNWLDSPEKLEQLDLLKTALLTQKNKPRSLGKLCDDDPECYALIEAETRRLLRYCDDLNIIRQATATASLMILARAVLRNYEDRKMRIGALDYDDLIRKTDELLKKTSGQWVHYKLDGGIDHILMDEAQDTNPHQWNIIRNLSEEIFSGNSGRLRSLFVVGDEKQSIFSFQGADPVSFEAMRAYFERKSAEAEREMIRVPLEVSFRSSPPVLQLVDTVFESEHLRRRIGIPSEAALRHYSRRSKEAGLAELWPLQPKAPSKASDQWILPFAQQTAQAATGSLAEQIASQIHFWLQRGEILESQGRPINAGDILILVRTRNALVNDLIRQLKRRNLPVSGIDRLILSDQIGVQDLMSLARFARLPDDEFSLACLLRSPLLGCEEEELMRLALNRPSSLWTSVQNQASPALVSWLQEIISFGRTAAPFEFFEFALNRPCPADPQGTGWRAMTARLGSDVIDPLEELMSLCLRLEDQGIRTLESLIVWQQKNPVEIKREMEEAGSQIRIMTVHASKGLEAPIVILPDTTSVPTRQKTERFLWPDQSGLAAPLWSSSSSNECATFSEAREALLENQFDEYARLLYVALTRARDRIYIMGLENGPKQMERSWYHMIEAAFNRMDNVEVLDNGRRRISAIQSAPAKDRRTAKPTLAPEETPAWLQHPPPADQAMPKPFSPSREESANLPAHSPLDPAQPYRFRRGIVTHKLLQFLPDIEDSMREDAARHYVARAGHDLPHSIQDSIVTETLAVLRDPDFAPVFGPGSLAEIPVTGRLSDGRIISGQIDRLIIGADTILIVDYKTNRPSPHNEKDVPDPYVRQLRAYRDALALIYPNHLISCALLWTDQPLLMPVTI
jgi:ATP-dependent helicase/nuclease subunit A